MSGKQVAVTIFSFALSILGVIEIVSSQYSDRYIYDSQKDNVLLYSKINQRTVSFKIINNRKEDIKVTLKNLTATQKGNIEFESFSPDFFFVKAEESFYQQFEFTNYGQIIDWHVDYWNWEVQ
ncbi:MAG: hypothetical protein ACPGVH_07295 [Chitinophagales bacterium]